MFLIMENILCNFNARPSMPSRFAQKAYDQKHTQLSMSLAYPRFFILRTLFLFSIFLFECNSYSYSQKVEKESLEAIYDAKARKPIGDILTYDLEVKYQGFSYVEGLQPSPPKGFRAILDPSKADIRFEIIHYGIETVGIDTLSMATKEFHIRENFSLDFSLRVLENGKLVEEELYSSGKMMEGAQAQSKSLNFPKARTEKAAYRKKIKA